MRASAALGLAAIAILSSAATSCEVDYKFPETEFERRVTVNALISPQEDFQLDLAWSRPYEGEDMVFEPVFGAVAHLYENGTEVWNAIFQRGSDGSSDPAPMPPFRGREGCRYRLEIDVPGYGTVSAETSIPAMPSAEVSKIKEIDLYSHFLLSRLETDNNTAAVWIRGSSYYSNDLEFAAPKQHTSYFTASAFVDPVNGSNDPYDADEKGASVIYEKFLRIDAANLKAAVPLKFSASSNSYVFGQTKYHTLQITAASGDYDRYFRSRYKNSINTGELAEGNPFVEQISVWSNIENGMGIFAGFNTLTITQL